MRMKVGDRVVTPRGTGFVAYVGEFISVELDGHEQVCALFEDSEVLVLT